MIAAMDYSEAEKGAVLVVAGNRGLQEAITTIACAMAVSVQDATDALTAVGQCGTAVEDLMYAVMSYYIEADVYEDWSTPEEEETPPEFQAFFYGEKRRVRPETQAPCAPRVFVRRIICCNRKGIGFRHRKRR